MAIFFFDFHDGKDYFRDEEGSELSNPEMAAVEALETLAEFARCKTLEGGRRDITVDVRTEAELVIFTATQSLVARWTEQPDAAGTISHDTLGQQHRVPSPLPATLPQGASVHVAPNALHHGRSVAGHPASSPPLSG